MEEVKVKKTRAPRSEEAKQKTREKMLARAAKLREENGGKAANPETTEKLRVAGSKGGKGHGANSKMRRLDGSKATKLIVELLDMVNDLHCAEANAEVLAALQESFPENQFRLSKNGSEIEFCRSSTDIRMQFGAIGLSIWKKVFKCIQQGGYSDETQMGYPSVWALNKADWHLFTTRKIMIQGKRGRHLTVSAFMEILMHHEEYKRVGTQFAVEEKMGVKQVVSTKKKMTTAAERKELKEVRQAFKELHDVKPAGNYRAAFIAKKEAHEKAVEESRKLAALEKEVA